MAKHETHLTTYKGSFEELAQELGDLTYDSLADFLSCLSEKLAKDAVADEGRNRVKLANCLRNASENLQVASSEIEKAWDICEPFMK